MKEKPESELKRLRNEIHKMMLEELYGGLSPTERTQYDAKAERIHELVREIQVSAAAQKNSESAMREQQHQWNKSAETDTPQIECRQAYRSRENIPRVSSSNRQQGTKRKTPEEKRPRAIGG